MYRKMGKFAIFLKLWKWSKCLATIQIGGGTRLLCPTYCHFCSTLLTTTNFWTVAVKRNILCFSLAWRFYGIMLEKNETSFIYPPLKANQAFYFTLLFLESIMTRPTFWLTWLPLCRFHQLHLTFRMDVFSAKFLASVCLQNQDSLTQINHIRLL